MSELRLFADRRGLHDATPWVLVDDALCVVEAGTGMASLAETRTASKVGKALIIVPDDIVGIISTTLPKLPAGKIIHALPAAVEDRLISPVEKVDLVLLDHRAGAQSTVAAWDREWRDALLATPAVAAIPSVRVVAESWGLPLQAGETGLLCDHPRYLMRLVDASTRLDDVGDSPLPPPIVSQCLKLEPGLASAPLRLFFAAGKPAETPAWLTESALSANTNTANASNALNMANLSPPALFDWRSASFDPRYSLYSRRGLYLEPAAVIRALHLPALLAFAWLAFEIIAATLDWGRLSLHKNNLRSQQEVIFRSVMGPAAALVDAEIQLRRRMDALRSTTGQVGVNDLLVLLTQLAGNANETAFPLKEIRYENGQLLLTPQSQDSGQAWLKAAQAAGLQAAVTDGLVKVAP